LSSAGHFADRLVTFFSSRLNSPMECRMVMAPDETTPWSCKIKLRFEVDTNGRAVVGNDGGEIPFGDTITDKDKLELQLRQAQLAVLNPTVSSDKFLDIDVENVGSVINSKKQLSFTPNLVVLEIVSQSPSFTFVDLPGTLLPAYSAFSSELSVAPLSHCPVRFRHHPVRSRRRRPSFPSDHQGPLDPIHLSSLDHHPSGCIVREYVASFALSNAPLVQRASN
jgi:hypothetical protein